MSNSFEKNIKFFKKLPLVLINVIFITPYMLIYSIKIIIFQILITFPIIKISLMKGLVDKPNNRKFHLKATPYTGGIILSVTYLFIVFLTEFDDHSLNLIFSYAFIISLTGLVDDRYNVKPGTKLLLQSIPIFFLIDQNLYLSDLGNYNFIDTINLGSIDKIFTFLCCLLLINAFNYSDGIDGLLPSISIIIFISFAVFLLKINNMAYLNIILITFPLIIFLFFNFGILKKHKTFLGDSGSNLLGFIISFIAVYLYNEKGVHPALIVWPLAYLVYEFLSVTIFRIINNKGTFKPGKDHLHYEIINIFKLNQYTALFLILCINIFFVLFGSYIFYKTSPDISMIVFILIFIIYLGFKYLIHNFKIELK